MGSMIDFKRPDGSSCKGYVAEAGSGVLLFGITPPRQTASVARIKEIAEVTLGRLAAVDLDGLVLYDIDDESDRNPVERPFPYLPTIDPAVFLGDYLRGWDRTAVVYRCVGKYAEHELRDWLEAADAERVMSVFVGASSSEIVVTNGVLDGTYLGHGFRYFGSAPIAETLAVEVRVRAVT